MKKKPDPIPPTPLKGERDARSATLAEIEALFPKALFPPSEGGDDGIVSQVCRLINEGANVRAHLNVTRKMLDEIEASLPPAYPNEFGLAQRVRGLVARSAPRTEPGLSPRDRAILAPLLDTIDAHLIDNDAERALAAVRAVVGVERG